MINNTNDIAKEIQYLEKQEKEMTLSIHIAGKLDFGIQSRLMVEKRDFIIHHIDNLKQCLAVINELKK